MSALPRKTNPLFALHPANVTDRVRFATVAKHSRFLCPGRLYVIARRTYVPHYVARFPIRRPGSPFPVVRSHAYSSTWYFRRAWKVTTYRPPSLTGPSFALSLILSTTTPHRRTCVLTPLHFGSSSLSIRSSRSHLARPCDSAQFS